MKTQILTLIAICFIQVVFAQEKELVGEWQIFEFSNTYNGENNITDKNALKENKSVWTMVFSESGAFNQSSNMRTGQVETQEGTWTISENDLNLAMNVQGREITIVYQFIIKAKQLILTRSNPNKSMILNISFDKSSK